MLEAVRGARGAHNTPSEVYVFFAYVAYGSLCSEILRVAYVKTTWSAERPDLTYWTMYTFRVRA